MTERIEVRKTFKLYINGAFVRSESGRTYEAVDEHGAFLANVAMASRKDARDAVVAARAGQAAWANATAYNRGQVLYRIAEVMESRRSQFNEELMLTTGASDKKANRIIDTAIDRVVWYAGWTDKLAAVVGGVNPVAGPFLNYSLPEPTGVVAVIAPQDDSLLGLVSVLAPVIATGNSAVVIASHALPIPAITLSEVLATSDVPAGVVNILTGEYGEIAPWLAEHMDVDALDLTGAVEPNTAKELEAAAAINVKRVFRPGKEDWSKTPSVARLRMWTETKTVWQTVGA